jgi:hypothetical protein
MILLVLVRDRNTWTLLDRKRHIYSISKCLFLCILPIAFICEKHFSNNFFTQKTKLHKYALPSLFLREDKQTSINNVRPAEQIENSTITENPTVENLILPVMPKAQNRHPTKSSSVLQVLECKKVSSLTSKGRNIYYMD